MREVRLVGVRVDLRSRNPVVFLQETDGARALPIYIHAVEATSIAHAIEGEAPPRPLTHDLFVDVLEALEATLERVVITEVRDETYFAELHLVQRGRAIVISARPSDGIALAARVDAPIFVADDLLDLAGVLLEEEDDDDEVTSEPVPHEEAEEIVDEFRSFLNSIRPEDFSG